MGRKEHRATQADLRWVRAMMAVCRPWARALEYVGWGSPEAAVTCFAAAVRLEERRRLATLSAEELRATLEADVASMRS